MKLHHRMTFLAGVLIGLTLFPANSLAVGPVCRDDSAIKYDVDFSDAKNHYLNVTATFPSEGDQTEVMMAVWTPGSYLVREYARHLDSMVVTADGKPIEFKKIKKNRWLVETGDVESFQIKYRLYCNEMTVRTNWLGKQYGVINGAPTFLTLPDRLDQEHIVNLQLPSHWKRSATSLAAHGDKAHAYLAKNYDELVDSPFVVGNLQVYPFYVGGIEHQLVNVGDTGYWDGAKVAADLKQIVSAHHQMWGDIPYDRYLFLNVICERGGGLEHDNSTLIMTSRWSFRDKRRYESWLSLASHEFFHTWNVRRLRPKSLAKYDYENEVYTDSLWVAEGVTSYYEDLALVRSGVISRDKYIKRLSANVEQVQNTAGRKKQSLKESSFDTWIKHYRPDENSSNTRISYYSKGAVAAMLLDAKIRKITDHEKSLDHVMQKMYQTYQESGYTQAEFREVASDVAGEDLTDWFTLAIDSTNELDFSDLTALSIKVPNTKEETTSTSDDENDNDEDSDGETESESSSRDEKPTPEQQRWLGIRASGSGGRVVVNSVKPDSPASAVGLVVDDEIVAINGYRVSGSIDSRLAQYSIGDEIEVLISRRGKLQELSMTIAGKAKEDWKLRFVKKPDDDQKKQLDAWLGAESN